jgi:hypothetical protein
MSIAQNLLDYRNSVIECQSFIDHAHLKYANGSYKINQNLRIFISESAFLKIFIAWETFLEQCFVDYLLNEPSILVNRPAKWANPIDRVHANKMIIGTQKYMDWANPELVRRLSEVYFHNGYLFNTQLGAINNDLLDLKTIRNSAAHLSSTTSSKLDGLSTRILGRPCVNFTAYNLLFANDPLSTTTPISNILTKYLTLLDVSAEIIANG